MNKKTFFELLESLYGKKNCYLVNITEVDLERKQIECAFLVPQEADYTEVYVPYVTAEDYIRCISQLLIIAVVLFFAKEADLNYDDKEEIKDSFAKLQWFYKKIERFKFKRLNLKDKSFSLIGKMGRIRKYEKDKFFIECEIISDSMSAEVKSCWLTKGHEVLQ